MPTRTILELWGITPEYLTLVVEQNPSLRGMILGYIAERKLLDLFHADHRISGLRKDDDHDRTKKGDMVFDYRGQEFKVEVKSLQTNSIKIMEAGEWLPMMNKVRVPGSGKPKYRYVVNQTFLQVPLIRREAACYRGDVQCDASDKRDVELPDGSIVQTTNLRVGEFDILAAGAFAFREKWDFSFAKNSDLPRSVSRKYTEYQQRHLLATLIPVTWPPEPPFTADPFPLLDELLAKRRPKRNRGR